MEWAIPPKPLRVDTVSTSFIADNSREVSYLDSPGCNRRNRHASAVILAIARSMEGPSRLSLGFCAACAWIGDRKRRLTRPVDSTSAAIAGVFLFYRSWNSMGKQLSRRLSHLVISLDVPGLAGRQLRAVPSRNGTTIGIARNR